MKHIKHSGDFVVNNEYTIYAQGFNDPIVGKLFDIEVTGDNQILLVIKKTDESTPVKVFQSAITGFSVNQAAA